MALPTTEIFVAAAEAALGFALPRWLRSRLKQANGGALEVEGEFWELFSVPDTTDRKHVARSATHIAGETARARDWPGFPRQAIAIARHGGGDYLVLLPDPQAPLRLSDAPCIWRPGVDELPVQIAVPAL